MNGIVLGNDNDDDGIFIDNIIINFNNNINIINDDDVDNDINGDNNDDDNNDII